MNQDPLFIVAVLSALVALSEWLGRKPWFRHLGSALWVIVLTAVVTNLGLIPPYSDDIAVYRGIFSYVAPLAIFLLVLRVNLADILGAGLPMIGVFLLGALGTTMGVFIGLWVVDGATVFGPLYHALGGMFVATYVGGSVNYNAVALHYEVVKQGSLYAGAAAVDSAMTTLWMAVTVAVPRWLGRRQEADVSAADTETARMTSESVPGVADDDDDRERVNSRDVATLMALGGLSVWLCEWLAQSVAVPSIVLLTTLALVLAQTKWVQQLRGIEVTGWLAVMFFLAVIGALCDLQALAQIGTMGHHLILFVSIVLAVHGVVIFGGGALFKADPSLIAVASQANVGGSTTALALARSLGREQWVLPGVLVGALGNALGTYLGFVMAAFLQS